MVLAETGIDGAQLLQSTRKQAGRREQEDEQRDLRGHHRSPPGIPRAIGAGCAQFQSWLHVGPAGAERRKKPEQRGSDDRDRRRKHERACVRRNIEHDRAATAGHHGEEQIGHPVRERHSGGAAGGGEERTLRQELAHDPPARGSQRKPDRYLLLSRARPNDQQAREIGAGDEQHHAHRRHQNLKRQRELPAELVQSLRAGIELERHGRTRRRRLSGGELRPSHAQRRPRLLARHARRESPDQVEPSSVRRHLHRLCGKRRRDVDVASRLCPEELGRRDADDRERAPLHLENAPDDIRVAGEPPLPVAMADHGDGFAILFGQRASEQPRERRAPRGSCPTPDCASASSVFTVDADVRAQKRTERSESRKHVAAWGEIRRRQRR